MKIHLADYKLLAAKFNPTRFKAEEFVLLAKEAGIKYIVLTSKHHEGFAMFKSSDPFNVVDATPYKKDIEKAMADACKKYGMHFGLYYSQAQDRNHPGGAACSGHWDSAQDGSFDKYLED
jgi:alpha-L-fucosidase